MKIAILSDIHANYRALEAVIDQVDRWKPDHVLVAGDIVNRGPRSACCLQLVETKRQQAGWQVIHGNHEDYVIYRDEPDAPQSGPLYELFQPVRFTYQQLQRDVSALRAWPEKISLNFDAGDELRMVHASMRDNRDGIYPETDDATLAVQIAPAPAVFITGHTHRPLIRTLNSTLIINAGSVGLPFDGDTRACYARLMQTADGWQAEIVRLKYDLATAEQDFSDYGFLEGGGPLAKLILLELRLAMSQLYPWTTKYNQPVQSGAISVTEATQEFLENPVTQPYW